MAAKTPVMDRLIKTNSTEIEAHGDHVGLPAGLMGNSEVGHLNIGAGRVIVQVNYILIKFMIEISRFYNTLLFLEDIDRINNAVLRDEIKLNKTFIASCENAKAKTGRLHLMGLVKLFMHFSSLYYSLVLFMKYNILHIIQHFIRSAMEAFILILIICLV